MTFESLLQSRGAAEYADFVLPSIGATDRVLDVGCGPGSITLGLAEVAQEVTGVDPDDAGFAEARAYAIEHGIDNVTFTPGSIYGLEHPDASFDVVTMFSMLETLHDPLAGLAEIRRVVRPGGVVAASSIEYDGLILHGPDVALLRRFYELRLGIYDAQGDVFYHRGSELRGLFLEAGFTDVGATLAAFSYGTEERVRAFGLGRAEDCREEWYADGVTTYGLADRDELDGLEQAWLRWAESPDAFAAFTWGRVVARAPDT